MWFSLPHLKWKYNVICTSGPECRGKQKNSKRWVSSPTYHRTTICHYVWARYPTNLWALARLLTIQVHLIFQEGDFRATYEESTKIERQYKHYFDLTILNDNFDEAYNKLRRAIEMLSTEPQWVPISWVYWKWLVHLEHIKAPLFGLFWEIPNMCHDHKIFY